MVNLRLTYRDQRGTWLEAKALELDEAEPPQTLPLEARALRLELPDGTRRVRCVRSAQAGPGGKPAGYERLDNEIMAGLRLARLCEGGEYPKEVSRLVGYEADSATPFALLEPLRGKPVGKVAGTMLTDQQVRFKVSLLRAVRWLGAAGIAHRGIGPATVRWDGSHVQLVDFSQATLIGAPRTVIDTPPWQAPEQRPGQALGVVGPCDDLWAAGRLIFHVITGEELDDRAKLHALPDLAMLLDDVIGAAETRPSAQRLLERLAAADAPPRPIPADPSFERGKADFLRQRHRKHPHTASKEEPPSATRPAAPENASPSQPRRPSLAFPSALAWLAVVALVAVALALAMGG